jgi:hypothetical protein
VGKSAGKPRRLLEDNVKMDINGTRWESVDWILLAQKSAWWQGLVNMVIKITYEELLD